MPAHPAAGLTIGDRAPPFVLAAQDGQKCGLLDNAVSGHPVLLLLQGGGSSTAFRTALTELTNVHDTFKAAGAIVLAIAGPKGADATALPFRVLRDDDGAVAKAYGAHDASVALLLNGNARVVRLWHDLESLAEGSPAAVRELAEALGREPALLGPHPPVLVLPHALGVDDCAALVAAWESLEAAKQVAASGAKTVEGSVRFLEDYGRVRQHVLRDPALLTQVDGRLIRRIGQELHKAFQTKVSRREDYRIACYESVDGGMLRPHRDNMTERTQHRRFTVSVCLNAEEYEGGELRFAEYGRHRYRAETGTAVVFSCSLLHEVLPVTAGRRFMLGTHLFGD